MTEIHYVYELIRKSPGHGATRYIGVRTATNGDPKTDDYWSSSKKIAQQRAAGAKFERKILKTFPSREEAELYEAELHWQHMVGKNPHFYNVTAQLIEGQVDRLLPRERYRSPDGEWLWFKPGSEPPSWVHDPAKWAQFRDLSHKDSLRQQAGFPQTFEGLELPEWEFRNYYSDEMAFSASQPRHCHEPYLKLDYRNDAVNCAYFPQGCQPTGWFRGFAPAFSASGKPPKGWGLRFHVNPASQQVNSAYFPREATPKGWVEPETYEQMAKDRLLGWNDTADSAKEIRFICEISDGDDNLKDRLRSYRVAKWDFITSRDWENRLMASSLSSNEIQTVLQVVGRDQISRGLHRALDGSRCDDPGTQEIIMRQNLFRYFLHYGSDLTDAEWADTIAQLDVPEVDRALVWKMMMSQLGVHELPDAVAITAVTGQQPQNDQALHDHVSDMIEEATRLHQAAMRTVASVHSDPLSQLKKAKKLLQDCEILALDAASYAENSSMQETMASLYRQQGQIDLMINYVENNIKFKRSGMSYWMLFVLFGFIVVGMISATH